MTQLIYWQRVEAALVFGATLLLLWHFDAGLPWWVAILAFFAPDLSFIAYTAGNRVGAAIYNLVHTYAFGALLMAIGLMLDHPIAAALGALWLGHAGFDRMLGYGLKSTEGFSVTHLGLIGKKR